MLSKNHPIILFIDRNGFNVYQDVLTNIPKFNFTLDLVSNLDVVNEEQLTKLLGTFIQINKIVPGNLAVILSDNVIYIKDLVNPAQKPAPVQNSKTDEVQSFLEDVPFEDVLARVIKVGNTNRVVAANKGLIMTIVNAFVNKGSNIEAITPGFMYGQSVNFTMGLTPDNVRAVLGNTEVLRSGNLLTDQEKIIAFKSPEREIVGSPESGTKKPKNLRQYVLVGVFVILLIVLGIVYLSLGSSSDTTPPKSVKAENVSVNSASASTVPPTVTPNLIPSATSVPIDLKSVKIKITQSSQTAEKAVNLKNDLLAIGFTNIITENSDVSIPEKSSVIFSQNIPADLRNIVISQIRKTLPDTAVLENQDVGFTVNILIGKS